MEKPIFVVGHRNPDSDSICSALAYANLLQLKNRNAIACRLGTLNEESKFVTKYFDIEGPILIKDARSQIRDIDMDEPVLIHHTQTVKDAWELILKTRNKSLMVVDDIGKLVGVISSSDLSSTRLMLDEDLALLVSTASAGDLASTLNSTLLYEPKEFKTNGEIHIFYSQDKNKSERIKDSICIVSSDDHDYLTAMSYGAKCLIVVNDKKVSDEVIEQAKENNCAIILSKSDTITITKYINECIQVNKLMSSKMVTFRDDEFVNDVYKSIRNTRYRSYPVIDEFGDVCGQISRYHLNNYSKKRFILLDHSAKNQAIANIEDAEILEIIDHHHIGNIQTDYPIYYRNEKVGCTATIIYQMYKEQDVVPTLKIAGVLLSAIISDTLYFKSLTTTAMDIKCAKELAELANVNIDEYAMLLLGASVDIKEADLKEILRRDLKEYTIGRYKVAVGQTNYNNIEDIQVISEEFKNLLIKEQEKKQYDLVIMMFTHVAATGTIFEYAGPLGNIMNQIIDKVFREGSGFDGMILSRKQQLIPKMSAIIKNL